MKRKLILIIIAVMIAPLFAQEPQSEKVREEEFPVITAREKIITEDICKASDNVEIQWKGYRFYGDYIEFHYKDKKIFAKGRVTIVSEETVISGDELTFDLNTMSGEMTDASGMVEPSVRVKAKKWQQTDRDTQQLSKVEVTSCSQCNPRWKITASKGKLKKEKYISMKNVVLKVKNIPVFYFPYLRYPLKSESRVTGFLFPSVGQSERLGFFLRGAFFWNIRPDMDLTLNMDYFDSAGLGLAEDFRYLFPNVHGNISFYYFDHKLNKENENILKTSASSDYILKMNHTQKVDFLDTSIRINVDRQSDPAILNIHQKDTDSYSIRSYNSSMNIQSSLGFLKLKVSAEQSEILYTAQNQSRTTTTLPKIELNINREKIGNFPGYFTIRTIYSHYEKEGQRFEENEEESQLLEKAETERFDIFPSYYWDFLNLSWLSARINLRATQTIYPQSYDKESDSIIDESLYIGRYVGEIEFKGPELTRIFTGKDFKLQHSVEPYFKYKYISSLDDDTLDRIPKVVRSDFPEYSYIGFGLTSKLLYKSTTGKTGVRELISLSSGQKYFFDPKLANQNRKINGQYPSFSELDNSLRFQPSKNLSLSARLSYNYYKKTFSNTNIDLQYRTTDNSIQLSMQYNRRVNPYASDNYFLNRSRIRGNIGLDIPSFPIKFNSTVAYDITLKELNYGAVTATLDYQCIQFYGRYRVYTHLGDTFSEFSGGFNIGGFGAVSNFLGRPGE